MELAKIWKVVEEKDDELNARNDEIQTLIE